VVRDAAGGVEGRNEGVGPVMSQLSYRDEAAKAYDHAVAHVSTHFLPFLLRAARLKPAQRVLDAATGTGIAAEAALAVVGPDGHVTAADISPAMVDRARQRLAGSPNASVVVSDGQSLSFDQGTFDAVLCSLGLMFFPDPARGLSEFQRVLRPGGRAAVSVSTTPERSYNGRINVIIARYVPSLAEATARTFSLGDGARLRSLFEGAGFREVETTTAAHRFVLPSFEAYFAPFERGGASSGQAYVALPEAERRAVREEVRRNLRDKGGPIEIEVEERFASGRR
jgi:ubiquinone/menaquinone biosynthesis C-methylase UbiE